MLVVSSKHGRPQMRLRALAQACLLAAALPSLPALAQDAPYLDDRSTPEALVESFYNAVDRGEYARAWSYYEGLGDFDTLAAGYAETAHVTVTVGEVTQEGAAGSTYYSIPVALDAEDRAGRHTYFAGCYTARLANPALQARPPFQPMHILSGSLRRADDGAAPPATCAAP
jgi:hypothetical protein